MRTTEQLQNRAIDGIVSHPRTVLIVFLIATGLLGWQARKFRIDASADTLLMRDNSDYIKTRVVTQRFAPQEFLLIAYEPKEHDVLSEQTFEDLRTLSAQVGKMDRVKSVRSILNAPLFTLADAELSSDIDPSTWTIAHQNYDIDTVRRTLAGHPIYEDLLINSKQTATALQVLFKGDEELSRIDKEMVALQEKTLDGPLGEREQVRWTDLKQRADPIRRRLDQIRTREVQTIRDIVAPFESRANIYIGGVHVLGFQLIRIIKNDLIVFGGAIAAMICLILFVIFRRLRWVMIPVVCCACSLLATMGLFGMLGLKTTVISSNFVALQLILTLAIVVHLVVQYREYNKQHPHWDQARLVRETLQRKAGPCFYAGLTTSVGFASLLFSGLHPVISFGWMMIIAMFFSIGVSLVLFPALMAIFGREEATAELSLASGLLGSLRAVTLGHARWIAIATIVLFGAGIAGALRLDVENSFLNYFRKSTRVHHELSFIDRQFGGSTPLDLVYSLPEEDQSSQVVMTAKTVEVLQRVQQSLKKHTAIGKTMSLVNFTELARQINDNRPVTEYELTALYWLMDESLREDLLGSFFSPDHGQARFSIRIKDTTPGLDRGQLLSDIRDDMQRLDIPANRYSLTNLFVLYQDILQRLFRSQIQTLGIVYAVLFVTFWMVFRSLRVAAVAMIPNALATAVVLGAMGWMRIPLDLMTITIAAIAMGIAVDDTIHYTHRYLEEVRDHPPKDAVKRSHESVGLAVLYTSLIIILGFSLLAFSDFVPSVLFGLLTGLAMLLALIGDLCVLPALLARFVDDRG